MLFLILDLPGEPDAHAGPGAGYTTASDAGKAGSGLPAPLSPSVDLVVLFIWPSFSPQAYFVMEPLIGLYAGLILLRETSPFPAPHTYLGGVKVMSHFTGF